MLETRNLKLDPDTGWVALKLPGTDDEPIGHIDDGNACPWEFRDEWDYFCREMRDRRAFAAGIEATVNASYYSQLGVPSRN